MPAVMEIEHSTGVVTGLARMKRLKDQLPPFQTRWVVVAPDEDRSKVLKEANEPQFHDLQTMFFPYSAVDELYALCQKRRLTNKAANEGFLDCFMEPCLTGLTASPLIGTWPEIPSGTSAPLRSGSYGYIRSST